MIKKEKVWNDVITNRKTKEMLCDGSFCVAEHALHDPCGHAKGQSGVRLSDDRPGRNDWNDV